MGLAIFMDASFNDCEHGKSTETSVIFYAWCPVNWASKKENIVAKRSTSAEYIAFDAAVQETMWLIKTQQSIKQQLSVELFTDSDNGYAIMSSDNYAEGTK